MGLFGVCKAYALFDEGVGYAQGINFIAMPLLFNMTEEEAFTLLVRLMSKYDLRSMFTGDLAGLHLRLYQFERLLEDHDPALYCHLRRRKRWATAVCDAMVSHALRISFPATAGTAHL